MSSKRRAGGRARARDSVVSRLVRRPNRDRYSQQASAREWMHGDPTGLQRAVLTHSFRRTVAGLFVLSIVLGVLASPAVIDHVMRQGRDAATTLVRSIAVQGNLRLAAATVARASGIAHDSPADEVSTKQVVSALEKHPWIRRADATLLPDGKLVIRIKEREPVALVRSPGAGSATIWRLIDRTGTPFVQTRAEEWSRLPRFRSRRPLVTGEVDPALSEALEIARLMRGRAGWHPTRHEIELPEKASGRGWVLHSRTLPHTIILGEEDLEPRLERLALLLDSDLPSARGAAEIDLRFAGLAVLRSRSPSR